MSLASIELNATTNRRLKSSISLYFQCEGTAQGNCNSYKEDALKYTFHEVTDTAVRVLFHILISPISIYTSRAFWARLAMFHVIEFNLWPKSSASQSIEK